MAETDSLKGKVVLDLCSGFQIIRQSVLDAGARYVAVDIQVPRTVINPQQRRVAIVLRYGNELLSVRHHLRDGTTCMTLPGGKQETQDESLHAAGVRELFEETGLQQQDWQARIASGPQVKALKHTTYYIYTLNQTIPRELLTSRFKDRKETKLMDRMQWIDLNNVSSDSQSWRQEDAQLMAMMTNKAN